MEKMHALPSHAVSIIQVTRCVKLAQLLHKFIFERWIEIDRVERSLQRVECCTHEYVPCGVLCAV